MSFPNKYEKKVLKNFINSRFSRMRISHEKINRLYTMLWSVKSKYGIRYFTRPNTLKPSFMIPGFPKCGTTSLYYYLSTHPNIEGSQPKETKFFSYEYSKGMGYYSLHFPMPKKDLMTFDATQTYLYNHFAMKRIKKELPECKFIICLRNPVEQIISRYSYQKGNGREILPLEECLNQETDRAKQFHERHSSEYVNPWAAGMSYPYRYVATYINHVKHALTLFERKQFLFIKSDDLFNNTQKTVSKIFEFLNVPDCKIDPVIHNASKHVNIDDKLIKELQDYFRPYNKQLEDLLGMNFNWDDKIN